MVLTNGADFTVSGNVATLGSPAGNAWCYDSEKITITSAIKYYHNDVLQYTSTNFSSGDYYPYLSARGTNGDEWTYSRGSDSIGFYINWVPSNFTPAAGGKYLGANDAIVDVEDAISFADHIQNPGKYHHIRENDTSVYSIPGEPAVEQGDTFKIYYATDPPPSGSFFPPPPAYVKI